MTLLRILAYSSAVSTYVLILLGGYVRASGSSLACPDWPLCHGQIIPPLSGPVLIEYTHRLFTIVTSLFIFATMLLVWISHRQSRPLLAFSTASFVLLVAQILLGMATVTTGLDPLLRFSHLAAATSLFALVMITAFTARNLRLR